MADTKISAMTAITAPVSTDELVVASSSLTKKIVAANLAKLMPGYELGYKEVTSGVTNTQTAQASATTLVTMDAITFDGLTVIVQFFCVSVGHTVDQGLINVDLWQDSTDVAIMGRVRTASTSATGTALFTSFRYTPTAGSKVLSARVWNDAGTATFAAGAGTGAVAVPMFMRVIKAGV